MKTHDLIQGTPEWAAHRATHFNGSDAPAMMGCSPYKTRTELLHEMHTGLAPEVDSATQRRFDDGHRFEALARPLAEAIVGQELYPVTGSLGKLSASFDGLTMDESIAFEHKTLNDELRGLLPAPEMVDHEPANAIIPMHYRIQMQQQCMVSGATRVLFMGSKWRLDQSSGEWVLEDTRHCWYESDATLAAEITAGWAQFEVDLANYEPPAAAAPLPTGRAPETLPALLITVRGEVTDSNLASFKEVALAAIRSVNRDLKTDQDFADADKAVKWCSDIEDRVAGAKQHALSQTATIDSLFKTMDDISAEARQVRLDLEKLVKARKVSLKTEMLTETQTALGDHIRSLNTRLGRDYMPQVPVDFAGAIASKRNFDSMRDALNATLANAKIAANATADKIDANLKVLREQAADFKFLFADAGQIVLKAPDDLQALVKLRISEHQAEVTRKEEETRERIRAEEQAKAEKDARDKLAREAEAQRLADAATAQANAAAELAAAKASPEGAELSPAAQALNETEGASRFAAAHPKVANVVPMRATAAPLSAAAPATPPTLKLGEISERLGFTLTAEFLKSLGFEPSAVVKAAKLFHEHQYPQILAALVSHIEALQAKQAA